MRLDVPSLTWNLIAAGFDNGPYFGLELPPRDGKPVLDMYFQWYRESVLRKEVNATIMFGKIVQEILRLSYRDAGPDRRAVLANTSLLIQQQLVAIGYRSVVDNPPIFQPALVAAPVAAPAPAPGPARVGPLALIARALGPEGHRNM